MEIPIPLYGLVVEEELRTTKSGSYFWQVILKTTVGNLKCFIWGVESSAAANPKLPHTNDIIEVTDFKNQLEERGNVVINNFVRITKNDLPENAKSIVEVAKADPKDFERAMALIRDSSFWADPKYHKFVMACLGSLDQEKLEAAPAATHIHHTYQGGLIVHTAEVLDLCRSIVESKLSQQYAFLDKDVLYAGAILHDMGKVETYFISELGTAHQLTTEKSIGHMFYGMHLVLAESLKHDDIEEEFVNELLHLIASHHGEIEYGSIKKPLCEEAAILSRMDYLSSRNGMIDKNLRDAKKAGQPLQDEFKIYGDFYFASRGIKKYYEEIERD